MKSRNKILRFFGCLAGAAILLSSLNYGAQKTAGGRENPKSKAVSTEPAASPLLPPASAPPGSEEKALVRMPDRDPFRQLVVRENDEALSPAFPGKRGLRVRQLQVKGIVKAGEHYFAVIDTRQSAGALFFRENDEVSDGRIVAITEDSVLFKERLIDPLGKPYWRDVQKKISGSGGVIP